MFTHFLSAAIAAGALTSLPLLAQDHSAHQKAQATFMEGASVAIEGCVTAAENDDAFVIGAVREIPAHPIDTGLRRFYRLDSVDKLRDKVGQVVLIQGRIDGIDDGQIEVKPGKAKDGGTLVELEVPGRDIDTTPAVIGAVGTTGSADAPKTKVTVIKLKVDKVTPVRACGT